MSFVGIKSEPQKLILEFLKDHPGATNRDIRDFLGPEYHSGQVTNLLTTLKYRKNAIENRGGHASKGRWFLKKAPDEDIYYQKAQALINEMLSVSPAFRTELLAKRLEELQS